MIVKPVKTEKIQAGSADLFELLDKHLVQLQERSVVVITSKIVSLCENRVAPGDTDKEELVKQESDYYLPSNLSHYGYHFTIKNRTLISMAGVDESNGGGDFILWPSDPQKTANEVRQYLSDKFNLKELGVIISDSTCIPMRLGTIGIPLAYSGFFGVNDYIGSPDLFGRKFKVSRSGVALGLTAAATVVMGEGTEQTPIAVIEDLPFVKFHHENPSQEELDQFFMGLDEDLFAPIIKSVPWKKGNHQ